MKITIITIGKKHDTAIKTLIETYQQRIQAAMTLEWRYVSPSSLAAQAARKQESQKLLQIVKPSDMVWLLDERGEQISSPALAAKLNVMQLHAVRNIAIIIGGAYGVDDTVRSRASWVWSLSSLVFPHQLVRLLLVEQLYRATQINKGTGYHHA